MPTLRGVDEVFVDDFNVVDDFNFVDVVLMLTASSGGDAKKLTVDHFFFSQLPLS